MPTISVIIPTRDRPALAGRAIASALAQRDVDVEVVVVDDGSRPPFMAPTSPRVSVIRHVRPQGVPAARNSGVRAAHADWIALLDDDDYWAPDKLRTQLAAAESAQAEFVCASALVVAGGHVVGVAKALSAPDLVAGMGAANLVPAGSSNVLVSAAAIERAGEFDVRLKHLDDWDMWIRLVQLAPVATCPQPLLAYVQHPNSRHVTDRRELRADARRLRQLHRDRGEIIDFDHGVFALFLADGQRQSGHPWRAAAIQVSAGVRHGRPDYVRSAAAELARATGLLRRERRIQPLTPSWVADQWKLPPE